MSYLGLRQTDFGTTRMVESAGEAFLYFAGNEGAGTPVDAIFEELQPEVVPQFDGRIALRAANMQVPEDTIASVSRNDVFRRVTSGEDWTVHAPPMTENGMHRFVVTRDDGIEKTEQGFRINRR